MQIKSIEGLQPEELKRELERGAKFVVYQYCISVIVMTFKRPSAIYFIRSGESRFAKGLGFTFISLLFGWWGIPWGPIYTIGSFIQNMGGGKDVTHAVIGAINAHVAQ